MRCHRDRIAADRALTFASTQVTAAFRSVSDATHARRAGGTGAFTASDRAAAVGAP